MSQDESLYTEPLLGYRLWALEDGELRSVVFSDRWDDELKAAACRYCGAAPGRRCQCGFWACSSLDSVARFFDLGILCLEPSQRDRYVIGALAASGRVKAHFGGFRCEQAKIIGLLLTKAQQASEPQLQRDFMCFSDPEALRRCASEFASPMPAELEPANPLGQEHHQALLEIGRSPDMTALAELATASGMSAAELHELRAYMQPR